MSGLREERILRAGEPKPVVGSAALIRLLRGHVQEHRLEITLVSHGSCCDLNEFAKAMADETRQRILSLLQAGEMNESDIVAHLDLTQPTISHHLALLRRANLVKARREGKRIFYRANRACVLECCGEILSRYKTPKPEA